MKKSTKAVICALLGGVVGFGVYSYKVKQEQRHQWVNQLSPDEVGRQDAVTITGMTKQGKDFSVFHYDCNEENSFNILINTPKQEPTVKLIESRSEHGQKINHWYVTHSDPWHFTDAHGTTWTIEAGQVTGHKGQADGMVCKFNLQGSTDATVATEDENYFAQAGA
ncbi:TPA: hypothetical protein JG872_000358 [Enterobacter hormaechei subsp. xiangfangensis]|nr:hypothetical protein [Enterobacter hormaechei subsp. xiangfangensis]HAV1860664.1 hypothetical protein [Enterobacter hormaechei subsp. xiangfangensis]